MPELKKTSSKAEKATEAKATFPDYTLQNMHTPNPLFWERLSYCPQGAYTNVSFFLRDSGERRDDLLEAKEYTDPATSNSAACNVLMTILHIVRWTGGDTGERLDQNSSKSKDCYAVNDSGSRNLR